MFWAFMTGSRIYKDTGCATKVVGMQKRCETLVLVCPFFFFEDKSLGIVNPTASVQSLALLSFVQKLITDEHWQLAVLLS